MGAVQAQDYPGAKWSLGMRVREATDASIEAACAAGSILRTHVLRPTWHFVAPADIRWLLGLSAPRVKATMAYGNRLMKLDEAVFARANELIGAALEGGRQLTRTELGAALARGGIVATGQRLAHIIMNAELDTLVCSGPRRGKQFTYALLAERAPQATTLPREQAVAELTRRYFISHGPATVRDFVWWSGLTTADARAGIAGLGERLTHETIDGASDDSAAAELPTGGADGGAAAPIAHLLPTFDEYHVGYADFDRTRRGGPEAAGELAHMSSLLLDGQVVGSWHRTLSARAVAVAIAPFGSLSPGARAAVAAAIERYAAFLGLSATYKLE